jgi:aspartate-semialdehyde dehydrogenase
MSASAALRVAVVGASGALGSDVVSVLEERRFPVEELVPIATDRSMGTDVEFHGELFPVITDPPRLRGVDLVFLCAPAGASLDVARQALRVEVPCFDLSGALANQPDVPLLVADLGIATGDLAKPLVATPTGPAIPLALVLAPIARGPGLRRAVITSFEATSGGGREGMDSLSKEVLAIFNQEEPPDPEVFERSIAFACLPTIGELGEDGSTSHELALVRDLQRLLQAEIPLAVTALQAPTFSGDGISLGIETRDPVDLEKLALLLSRAPGLELCSHDPRGPTTRDTCGEDAALLGRLRRDPSVEHGVLLWMVADVARLAALNAVKLAEARFGLQGEA